MSNDIKATAADATKQVIARAAKKSWEAGFLSWIFALIIVGCGWLVYQDKTSAIEERANMLNALSQNKEVMQELAEAIKKNVEQTEQTLRMYERESGERISASHKIATAVESLTLEMVKLRTEQAMAGGE